MDSTQYLLSLNNIYRIYSKFLSKENYNYILNLIKHYTKHKILSQKEAEIAETKCKDEWKILISKIIFELENQINKYDDILKEEDKELNLIKTKCELSELLLGDYENLWDEVDNIYRKIFSKVNSEKRNFKRNWIGHIISFILGITGTLLLKIFFNL